MPWRLLQDDGSGEVNARAKAMSGYDPQGTALMFEDTTTNKILGGWWFEKYTGKGGSVTVHWHGSEGNWIRRGMLKLLEAYVFDQLEVRCVIGEIAETNYKVRAINEHVGFLEFGRIEGYFPDHALVLYTLTRKNFILTRLDAMKDVKKDAKKEEAVDGQA